MASAASGVTARARPRGVVDADDARAAGEAVTRIDDVVRVAYRDDGAVGRAVTGVSALANIVCACVTRASDAAVRTGRESVRFAWITFCGF